MAQNSTPMLEQYHRIKREHRDAILMFRMGDFYEMFFEDAENASRVLDIALTARGKGTQNEAPMCGVPHHAVDSYIARLIASGHKVAVCDQVEDARAARGLVRREVVRVLSPGTMTDPASIDARENIYIACLFPADATSVGAAWIDLSTGEFRLSQTSGPDAWDQIAQQVAALRPREILRPEGSETLMHLPAEASRDIVMNSLEGWVFGRDAAYRTLSEQMGTASLAGFGCEEMELAVRAGGALLHHLKATQRSALAHIDRVISFAPSDHMVLDQATLRTLEIVKPQSGQGRAGSLLGLLDLAATPMGSRRLRSWLLAPLLQVNRIEARLDAVAELAADTRRREQLRAWLKDVRDIERLLGRVTLGTANARDLLALKDSLVPVPLIAELAGAMSAALLNGRPGPLASLDTAGPPGEIDPVDDLRELLARAIADDPAATLHDGGMIRAGYRAELDDLRAISRDGKSYIAAMEARERERSGIPSLKVRYNRVFGYYIEVSRSHLGQVPSDYERRQTLVGAERFATPELKQYEEKVLTAQETICELEHTLFQELREEVSRRATRLKRTADRIGDIDTLAALAEVAVARGYVRPVVTESPGIQISEGRHPVVEAIGAGERFVPNDLEFGGDSDARILIVTGPNMGGKSTYLRQSALIALMAQAGSFVPAGRAEIGVVDRIFSRIGASDNLAGGQSTFMVEMQETANILHNATARSLILLDEVGRGTSTFDGLSIAWAIVEHLHDTPEQPPRVLFATHYHELTELALTRPRIRNLTLSVRESGHDVVFLRKIVEGAADRSYGIQVARLAGLPRPVIDRAREVLANLETNEFGRDGMPKLARRGSVPAAERRGQLTLFGAPDDPATAEVAAELRGTDIERTTPLEALSLIERLKKRLDGPGS